jgi:hypothetical protein
MSGPVSRLGWRSGFEHPLSVAGKAGADEAASPGGEAILAVAGVVAGFGPRVLSFSDSHADRAGRLVSGWGSQPEDSDYLEGRISAGGIGQGHFIPKNG